MAGPNDLHDIKNRIVTFSAENDRNISASFSVFRNARMKEAKLSFEVFNKEKRGGPVFSAPFTTRWCAETRLIWEDLLANGEAGQKEVFPVFKSTFVDGKRKSELLGQLVYGLDKGGMPYIAVAVDGQTYKFPLRTDPSFGRQDDYPATRTAAAGVRGMLADMAKGEFVVSASLLAAPEAQEGGGGGFNKGRGGGGGNYGNRGGGSSSVDDDLAF